MLENAKKLFHVIDDIEETWEEEEIKVNDQSESSCLKIKVKRGITKRKIFDTLRYSIWFLIFFWGVQ